MFRFCFLFHIFHSWKHKFVYVYTNIAITHIHFPWAMWFFDFLWLCNLFIGIWMIFIFHCFSVAFLFKKIPVFFLGHFSHNFHYFKFKEKLSKLQHILYNFRYVHMVICETNLFHLFSLRFSQNRFGTHEFYLIHKRTHEYFNI